MAVVVARSQAIRTEISLTGFDVRNVEPDETGHDVTD
jgi:hypothetical protein